MYFFSQFQTLKALLSKKISKAVILGQALLLGTGASLLLNSSAAATEVVNLKYRDTQISISTRELKSFAETGEIPTQLQDFFQATQQVPEFLSSLLTKEIRISPQFINRVLDSSTGEFVLLKLDETINTSSSGKDLEAIKSAVVASYNDDNRISVMELLEKYPISRVQIDLTSLEVAYNQVSTFVEEVLPALEIAKAFLQDLVCECETPQALVSPDSPPSLISTDDTNLPLQLQASDCKDSSALTATESNVSH
ncbi:MAG: alpha/beta hydrolase [Xenococcaceae cyanobacterium]